MSSPPWPTPYLSGRALEEFSPGDYKQHVRSLLKRAKKKAPSIRIKKKKPPFVAKIGKRGLLLTVNRKPKWMSREEIDSIARDLGLPLNEVWLTVMKKRKEPIRISTQEEEDRITKDLRGLDEVWPKV